MQELPEEFANLVRHDISACAQEHYQAAIAHSEAEHAKLAPALEAVAEAKRARQALTVRASKGEHIGAKAIEAADRAIRDAETQSAFVHEVCAGMVDEINAAHADVQRARGLTFQPVMNEVLRRQRVALERRRNAEREIVLAEEELAALRPIVNYAISRGARSSVIEVPPPENEGAPAEMASAA